MESERKLKGARKESERSGSVGAVEQDADAAGPGVAQHHVGAAVAVDVPVKNFFLTVGVGLI